MEPCKVTAIANQKGGVGKTVSTVSLGVGLARAGKRVLLVDADPQASLTVSLGVKTPDELDVTLTTVMQAVIEKKPPPDGWGIIHAETSIEGRSIFAHDGRGKVAAAYEELTKEVMANERKPNARSRSQERIR